MAKSMQLSPLNMYFVTEQVPNKKVDGLDLARVPQVENP